MKKVLLTVCTVIMTTVASFAGANYPYNINETYNAGGCIITMIGNGTITIDEPAPGSNDPLHAESHGTVTFSFGPGCGYSSGMVVVVTFDYEQNQGGAPSVTGSDRASQAWLANNPTEAAHLSSEIQSHVIF